MVLPITARCNFDCVFCDRVWSEDPAVPLARVLDEAPMSELGGLRAVLGGGEPTLHPQLPGLLEGLRERGVRKLSLRSNGAWAGRPEAVAALKTAGLKQVDLLFPTPDPVLFDRLTGKRGAHAAVMRGVENLASARIALVARVPLLRPTLASLPRWLPTLHERLPGLTRIDLVHLDLADPRLQIRYEDLDAVLPHGSDHPWGPEVPPLVLDPGPGIPLCLADGLRHWRLSEDMPTAPGTKPAPCERCFVRRACSGLTKGFLAVYGAGHLRPVSMPGDEGLDRPREPVAPDPDRPFEPVKGVTYECPEDGGEATLASVRLRVGHACNRRCDFCFIPHHEKAGHDHEIAASIDAAVAEGVRELVMTGGEPTLVKELPDYIAQASDGGVRRIVLQTNAIRLADSDFTRKLVDSGLTSTVISLHSHRDETLGAITGLPKTVDRIVRGVRNLVEAGIQASVTHVIGPRNHADLPDFTRFMIEETGLRRFCFIFATPVAWPMAREDIVVRFADAAPHVMAAMDVAIDHDVLVDGLAFKCGAPHCVVGGQPRYLLDAVPIPEQNRTPDWVRVPACRTCVLQDQCYGVRRLYAWLYGVEEFQPVLDPDLRAERWNTGRHLPRTPAAPLPHDPLQALMARAEALGVCLPAPRVTTFDSGHRVQLGPVSLGPVAASGDVQSSTQLARFQHLRNTALGVSAAGAHGVASGEPGAYLAHLAAAVPDGASLLTPHTSVRWSDWLEAEEPAGVQVLRRAPGLRMASVHSAVAVAAAALAEVGGERVIRVGIWGYGRAGRAFAKHFDRVVVGADRRPLLVACSDSRSACLEERGMEFERLSAFKVRHGRLPRVNARVGVPEDLFTEPLDLLLLSGRGPSLTGAHVPGLGARVVVDMTGGVTSSLEAALHGRGVLVVPTLLATCGPALLADAEHRGEETPPGRWVAERSAALFRSARTRGGTLTDALLRPQRDSGKGLSAGASAKGTSPRSP